MFPCQTQPELACFLRKQGNSLVKEVPASTMLSGSTNTLQGLGSSPLLLSEKRWLFSMILAE